MAVELNATVTKRIEVNHGLLVLQVTPDAQLGEFRPGQYTLLGLPGSAPRMEDSEPEDGPPDPDKLIRRAYSISSSSLQGEYLEFYIALVTTGALTPRLFRLQEGDRVWMGKKITGMFTLKDVPESHNVVFVATGTGLAPYISMLRSAYAFADRKTVIIHGARVSWDLGYRNILEGLAARHQSFSYLPIIDEIDRDPQWTGRVGLVYAYFEDGTVEKLLGHGVDPEKMGVFLCGNPAMIEGMEEMLGAKGFTIHSRKSPGSIYVEKYW